MGKKPSRKLSHIEPALTRRDFLLRAGGGFGALALTHLLGMDNVLAGPPVPSNPLALRPTFHPPKARSVIFLFMEGGPSHIDLFDPKPKLNELAGQKLPDSFGDVITAMGEHDSPLLRSKRKWKQHGRNGTWVSDWLPYTSRIVDDICVVRSCWADGLNHVGSVCQMNTGSIQAGRPSLGAWATYGLGTINQDLPSYVVLLDNSKLPVGGVRNWGAGFLPSTYQGTRFEFGANPIPNLKPPKGLSDKRQRGKLELLEEMNRRHAEGRSFNSDLEARIHSYELAYRMQATAPEAVDLDSEPDSIKQMYGYSQKETHAMARNCIMARRLVERGVRFVQVYSGSGSGWDAHANIEGNHTKMCRSSDQPCAALIMDLKQRGLLDETLVIWGGEFGRTPMSEKGNGRDHNPYGFTMWLAGGGIQGGRTIGATDELGLRAIEDPIHVRDLHATILHLMGLHPLELTFMHNGRMENPVINEGDVVSKIVEG